MMDADDLTFDIPADDLSQRDPNSGRTNYVHEPAEPPVPLGAGERHARLKADERQRCVAWAHRAPASMVTDSEKFLSGFVLDAEEEIAELRTLLDESRAALAKRHAAPNDIEEAMRELLIASYWNGSLYNDTAGHAMWSAKVQLAFDQLSELVGRSLANVQGDCARLTEERDALVDDLENLNAAYNQDIPAAHAAGRREGIDACIGIAGWCEAVRHCGNAEAMRKLLSEAT